MFEILPFNGLTNIELENEFMTSADKLKEVLENSTLPNFMKKFKPYFHQVGLNSKCFTEDDFNYSIKGNNTRFSIFHLNIRSLNKRHNDLTIYLSMLNMKFDVICLSEMWKFNLEFYRNILPHYTAYFEPPADSNVDGVAVFVKSDFKITNRNDLKLTCSDTVKVEDLWYEITTSTNETFLVGVIYQHPKGHVDKFTEVLEGTTTKIINDNKIKNCIIVGDLKIYLMKHITILVSF